MALLPSQLLHANVAEDETACPICFGTMLQPRALPGCAARHVFCAPCIGLWFQLCGSQRTCPIDRRAVSGCHSNPPHAVAAQLPAQPLLTASPLHTAAGRRGARLRRRRCPPVAQPARALPEPVARLHRAAALARTLPGAPLRRVPLPHGAVPTLQEAAERRDATRAHRALLRALRRVRRRHPARRRGVPRAAPLPRRRAPGLAQRCGGVGLHTLPRQGAAGRARLAGAARKGIEGLCGAART